MATPITATTTIRPGLLVGVKTSIKGNVTYTKRDLDEHKTASGAAKARWETERTIKDPAEHEAATKVRGKARNLLASICSQTEFGMLCPIIAAPDLERAVAEAKALCDEFNKTAKVTKLRFGVITGKIAQDDLQAVRAIRAEVRELITDMSEGLQTLDVETVRTAASRAKQLGQMLAPEAQVRVQLAIEAARAAAKKIVAAGEQGAVAIDCYAIKTLTEARTAFLDLDDAGEIAAPVVTGRAVDLTPDAGTVQAVQAVAAPKLELV